MKLIHIVGARPQFIKMAAVSRAVSEHNQRAAQDDHIHELIIHTGQHYDYGMSQVFFDELEIPKPDYNLVVGSGCHGEQTGEMLKRLEPVLIREHPDVVLTYGDTNSTLAGALAAAKLHIPVAHVEAGLRSFNRMMPEEINRVLTDHVSTWLFCPTKTAVENLEREGFHNVAKKGCLISLEDIGPSYAAESPLVLNIGDVMFDSVLYNLQLTEKRSDILKRLHLFPNEPNKPVTYALATIHRAENTDDPERLRSIFQALNEIARSVMPVILPLHPRTRKQLNMLFNPTDPMNPTNSIDPMNPTNPTNLVIIDPVSYLDMLLLEKNAKLILTDSGGVQKESFILKVPCVTLREETEWTETVSAGWNVLAGANTKHIVEAVEQFTSQERAEAQEELYGDGHASERVIAVITGQDEPLDS